MDRFLSVPWEPFSVPEESATSFTIPGSEANHSNGNATSAQTNVATPATLARLTGLQECNCQRRDSQKAAER